MIMQNITQMRVPGVSDKWQLLAKLVIVALALYISYKLIQMAIKEILALPGQVDNAFMQALGSLFGVSAPSSQYQAQAQNNLSYLQNYMSSRSASDPFSPSIYNNDNTSTGLTQAQAQSVVDAITSNSEPWYSAFTSNQGNVKAVYNAFNAVCASQADVSYIDSLFEAQNGTDIMTYMYNPSNYASGAGMSGTNTNATDLVTLIQWALKLPVT